MNINRTLTLPNHEKRDTRERQQKSAMPHTSYDKAQPCGLSKAAVYSFAESLAKQLDFKTGDDIDQLVSRIGGRIKIANTLTKDPEESGSLFVEAPDNFTIIVPAHTSLARDRFTVAHELGHFVLHYLWNRKHRGTPSGKMMALRKGSDRVEWEANWFAAGFLMPGTEFKKVHNKCGGSLSLVASKFGVSQHAAEVRASQLGLI